LFTGQVVRTANALDATSRTLLTEVQLSNGDVMLLPAMYAGVKFVITHAKSPWLIPANTLVIRPDGPQVAILGEDHTVHYQRAQSAGMVARRSRSSPVSTALSRSLPIPPAI
jgi:hypothetical protein